MCSYIIPINYSIAVSILGIDGDDDDDDDDATDDLRRNAVISYLNLLNKASLPDIVVQLICWVLGEYFDLLEDYDVQDIIDKLYNLLPRKHTGKLYNLLLQRKHTGKLVNRLISSNHLSLP